MGRDTFCILRGSATEQKPKSSPIQLPPGFHLPGNQLLKPAARRTRINNRSSSFRKVDPPLGMLCLLPITTAVDSPGIEPGLPPCHSGVFPLDHEPMLSEWTAGESNPDYLGANQVSCR